MIGVFWGAVWRRGPDLAITWVIDVESFARLGFDPFSANEGLVVPQVWVIDLHRSSIVSKCINLHFRVLHWISRCTSPPSPLAWDSVHGVIQLITHLEGKFVRHV